MFKGLSGQGIKDFLVKGKQKLEDQYQSVESTLNAFEQKITQTMVKPLQEVPVVKKIAEIDPKKIIESSLSQSTPPSEKVVVTENLYLNGIKIEAGSELIQRYITDLLALRENNRILIAKAQVTDKKIGPVFQYITNRNESMAQFSNQIVSTVPEINATIGKMKTDIDFICDKLDFLENALSQQTEELAAEAHNHFITMQVQQTKKYKESKQKELDTLETSLKTWVIKREQQQLELEKLRIQQQINEQMIKAKEKERADRIREQELALQRQREHLQVVSQLDTAFQQQLQNYKQFGVVGAVDPNVPVVTTTGSLRKKSSRRKKTRTLDEVDLRKLNENNSELEQFLKSGSEAERDQNNNNNSETNQDNESLSERESGTPTNALVAPLKEDVDEVVEMQFQKLGIGVNDTQTATNPTKVNNDSPMIQSKDEERDNRSNSNSNSSPVQPSILSSSQPEPQVTSDQDSKTEEKVADVDDSWM